VIFVIDHRWQLACSFGPVLFGKDMAAIIYDLLPKIINWWKSLVGSNARLSAKAQLSNMSPRFGLGNTAANSRAKGLRRPSYL
jgi:hypothetical protein